MGVGIVLVVGAIALMVIIKARDAKKVQQDA